MKNVIQHDKLDTYEFDDVFKQSKRLQDTVSEGQERLSTVDSLSQDMFYSLYKNIPRKHDSDVIDDGYKINEDFIDKSMRSKEYDQLRIGSKLDKMISALGTQSFIQNILTEFTDEELEDMDTQSKRAKENQEQMKQLQNQLEGFQDAGNRKKSGEVQQKIDQLKQAQQKHMKEVNKNLQKNTSRIRTVIKKSLEKAKETVDGIEGMMSGWGMESSDREIVSWEEKMSLAEELKDNVKLQKIADMIGRMKRLAISVQKQKIRKVPEEIQSITQGDDLSHVLASELIHLDEDTEVLFYKKYIDGELLQYELEGNDPEGKGPIVCCIDTSGSMSGDREIWSKGVAMGLFNIAKRQHRKFYAILFSNGIMNGWSGKSGRHNLAIRGNPASTDNSKTAKYFEIETKSGKEQRKKILEMLTTFLGGGTDFDEPLNKAIELVDGVERRADIVFITDGEARVSDSTLEQLKGQKELSVLGIGISNEAGGLDEFCDNVFMLGNILTEGQDTAEEVFNLL